VTPEGDGNNKAWKSTEVRETYCCLGRRRETPEIITELKKGNQHSAMRCPGIKPLVTEFNVIMQIMARFRLEPFS
jgi:hypothetical protein